MVVAMESVAVTLVKGDTPGIASALRLRSQGL